MSAPSSTSSSDAGGLGRFLVLFAVATALLAAAMLATVILVDPYGVSPVQLRIDGVNAFKPKRLHIDRRIKPLEVWQKAPRTLFLGTSRFHQSIDPAVLDGTAFAPAYNAAVPDGSLALFAGYLRYYPVLDPALERAVVELFLYNFMMPAPPGGPPPRLPLPDHRFDHSDLMRDAADLFLSRDALFASLLTVWRNATTGERGPEVLPGGHYHAPAGLDARQQFEGFPAFIWSLHPEPPQRQGLNEAAFEKVAEMQQVAARQDIDLVFLLTPNHAIFDCYVDLAGAWDVMEDWMLRLSRQAVVYSASQPNALVYEPISRRMTWWSDPFHFTLEMGRAITDSLAGRPRADLPADFLVRLTPENVPRLIAARKEAVARWQAANPDWYGMLRQEAVAAGVLPDPARP